MNYECKIRQLSLGWTLVSNVGRKYCENNIQQGTKQGATASWTATIMNTQAVRSGKKLERSRHLEKYSLRSTWMGSSTILTMLVGWSFKKTKAFSSVLPYKLNSLAMKSDSHFRSPQLDLWFEFSIPHRPMAKVPFPVAWTCNDETSEQIVGSAMASSEISTESYDCKVNANIVVHELFRTLIWLFQGADGGHGSV